MEIEQLKIEMLSRDENGFLHGFCLDLANKDLVKEFIEKFGEGNVSELLQYMRLALQSELS